MAEMAGVGEMAEMAGMGEMAEMAEKAERGERDGETQAQRRGQSCLRSHSKGGQAGPEPRPPGTILSPSPVQLQNSLNKTLSLPNSKVKGNLWKPHSSGGVATIAKPHNRRMLQLQKDWGSLL